MKTSTVSFLILLLAFAVSSCDKTNNLLEDGDMLFAQHKGASMPVLVRGNFESDVILLMVHGGIGGSSDAHIEDFEGMLEPDYLVAYWDQRHAGSSQGNFSQDEFTIDIMAEDMQVVIRLLKQQYGQDKKVFCVGHSWGVILGTYYLISQENELAGAIMSNGAHSSTQEYIGRMNYIRTYGQEMLDKGIPMAVDEINSEGQTFTNLEEVLAWVEANDPITTWEQLRTQYELINAVKPYVDETYLQSPDALGSVSSTELQFHSPYHPLIATVNSARSGLLRNSVANETSIQEFYEFGPQMDQITLPVLLIFGIYDHIIGPNVAEDYYEVIGTAEEDKELVLLENSGHSAIFRENMKFSQSVIAFVEKHR